jgi:uncharacterized protein YbjT (DUF2867 family)
MKIIITGTTGMAGEGVLLECLNNSKATEVLSISRKPCGIQHPKLKELIVPDFTQLADFSEQIKGYDACFYCAGISSVGMSEQKYHYITYDTTIAFAEALLQANPSIVFCFISGSHTDSSAKGRVMWARVKGKTENALMAMPFKAAYNFRPGGMQTLPGQKKAKALYTVVVKLIKLFSPSSIITLSELGKAMIHVTERTGSKRVLEIKDIKALAK